MVFTQPILDRLIQVHERYVQRQPNGRRAIFPYTQAPGLNLSRRDLSEADFTGANFARAQMLGTNLERASLYCADLTGVEARGANFRRADIRGAILRQADLSGANLDEADMRQAMLARADLPTGFTLAGSTAGPARGSGEQAFSVDFSHCSMKGAKLNNAKLSYANFTDALLHGIVLQGANLQGATFAGAVLTGVNLSNVVVDPRALAGCVRDPTAEADRRAGVLVREVEKSVLWVNSLGAEGAPAMVDGEDLRTVGDLFVGKGLTAFSAKGACAIGVDFSGAHLQGARFDGADLRDANFRGADLRGASFEGARLFHANFDDADLRPLQLPDGSKRLVNMVGARACDGLLSRFQT